MSLASLAAFLLAFLLLKGTSHLRTKPTKRQEGLIEKESQILKILSPGSSLDQHFLLTYLFHDPIQFLFFFLVKPIKVNFLP